MKTTQIPFCKYQGTGNDFILIDNRATTYLTRQDTKLVNHLCDRKFGIGADGLILLQNKEGYDFEMVYFNSDGSESTMCGNGGRCIVAFAKRLGIITDKATFLAIDGPHDARINEDNWVELKMKDVNNIELGDDYAILDTGSPHYVVFVEDVSDINIVENGQAIRYSERFKKEGINVNFVERNDEGIIVATYERGVEDETLSCGTGVTAAAIATHLAHSKKSNAIIPIESKGGNLEVKFQSKAGAFSDVWLCGSGTFVFKGDF